MTARLASEVSRVFHFGARLERPDSRRQAVRPHPIPSSSAVSSGVPHFRQITAPQSPHVIGSETSLAHFGQ